MSRSDIHSTFEALLNEHKRILYKICHLYCRNPDDREDLAQEIAVQLWRSFDTFDPRLRFSTWMYRVALNAAISFYRRESVRTRHVVAGGEHLLDAAQPPGRQEAVADLYRFIDTLEPLNKALLMLYLDGNSYEEIAAILGITATNVATKIGRLKQMLKQEFAGAIQSKKGESV